MERTEVRKGEGIRQASVQLGFISDSLDRAPAGLSSVVPSRRCQEGTDDWRLFACLRLEWNPIEADGSGGTIAQSQKDRKVRERHYKPP